MKGNLGECKKNVNLVGYEVGKAEFNIIFYPVHNLEKHYDNTPNTAIAKNTIKTPKIQQLSTNNTSSIIIPSCTVKTYFKIYDCVCNFENVELAFYSLFIFLVVGKTFNAVI